VAELERGLIVERVKAGLRNARAKGKVLGRPKKILDTKRIAPGSGRRLEADRSRDGRWRRNCLSCRPKIWEGEFFYPIAATRPGTSSFEA
jgi:hypothetical protein